MRLAGVLFWGFVIANFVPHALTQEVTIAQLRSFLRDEQRLRHPDTETANRLSSAWLSERLTSAAMSRLGADTAPGPAAMEQLRLLADVSLFAAPPANETVTLPRPSPEQQRDLLTRAAGYAQTALQHLPDFLAVRITRRFDNRPFALDAKQTKPTTQMHWIGEFKNQITYRHGAEVTDDFDAPHRTSTDLAMRPGLVSMGEFGPMLLLVFRDFKQGSIAWARWETDSVRGLLAVFHYAVPKSASHYLVDFCCYTIPQDETRVEMSFRDHPAYHGEFVISPDSGSVIRITIEADLDTSAPIMASQLAVEYGDIEIGGRSYLCPVQSIAMTALRNPTMERINGVGIERHLNKVEYRDYHKFGSTSRVIATP